MVIHFNGEIIDEDQLKIDIENRALKYGDAVFETIKYVNGKLMFWEDHYFRLMSTMRILRMNIPMTFSPEYLEEQIIETIKANHAEQSANRIRIQVTRKGGGKYLPQTRDVDITISSEPLATEGYDWPEDGLRIDVFKDHYKQVGLLSNLKTANSLLYVLAAIYRDENKLDECVLVNNKKEVVEGVNSNIFMVKGDEIFTPPLSAGCLKGVMRKNIIKLAENKGLKMKEETFSTFELQRADEVFFTNAIQGVVWAQSFRKKSYGNAVAKSLSVALNANARFQ